VDRCTDWRFRIGDFDKALFIFPAPCFAAAAITQQGLVPVTMSPVAMTASRLAGVASFRTCVVQTPCGLVHCFAPFAAAHDKFLDRYSLAVNPWAIDISFFNIDRDELALNCHLSN